MGMEQDLKYRTYLCLAIRSNLCIYVAEKLNEQKSAITQKKGRPLLDYALVRGTSPFEDSDGTTEVEMVKILLRLGSDPNQVIRLDGGQTVWCRFLLGCYQHHRVVTKPEVKRTWKEIIEEFLNCKADPSAKCQYREYRGSGTTAKYKRNIQEETVKILTVEDILKAVFPSDHRLGELLERKKEEATRGPGIWSLIKWAVGS